MKQIGRNEIVFILGREKNLALEELKVVLFRFGFDFDIYKIASNVVFANMGDLLDADLRNIMHNLAGTIKIFKIVGRAERDISTQMADILLKKKPTSTGKINFGISYFGKGFTRQHINSIALSAKKKLKGAMSLRYVEAKESLELSSILTLKNDLLGKGIEFGLFEDKIAVLVALNNPEEWNKRDYGKPAADKYSGMVPPKLARMLVNITLKGSSSNALVLDPFCGSGNILMEAMLLGCDVVGSDISDKAIKNTQTNLAWAAKEYDLKDHIKVFQADAAEYDFRKAVSNKEAIVAAEPFLGEPKKFRPTYKAAIGEYLKVKDLYLRFLSNISRLGDLTICLVFPLIETTDKGRFSLFLDSVDEIKKLGYTQACKSFVYGRDYQVVKREIVLLQPERKS